MSGRRSLRYFASTHLTPAFAGFDIVGHVNPALRFALHWALL
ncbi:MAG TPA: hypothetical protein VKB86_16755 [Pyrinomonadaceae bacterium]|nr:hypothetical protein [Pyrinomonadaceae bacterium]